MDLGIITSVIGVVGGMFTAADSYWFTKKRERDAAWQKEKLGYYKAFIESLNGVLEGSATDEGDREFDRATNNLILFAPQPVLEAVKSFRDYVDRDYVENKDADFTKEEHDLLLAQFLVEMRRDVGVFPQDNPKTFNVELYGSLEDENES